MTTVDRFPQVHIRPRTLAVQLRSRAGAVTPIALDLILDLDEHGDVIGLEILDFKRYTGQHTLDDVELREEDGYASHEASGTHISYSADEDVFYMTLKHAGRGASVEQRAVPGAAVLDAGGRLVAIEAELPE